MNETRQIMIDVDQWTDGLYDAMNKPECNCGEDDCYYCNEEVERPKNEYDEDYYNYLVGDFSCPN